MAHRDPDGPGDLLPGGLRDPLVIQRTVQAGGGALALGLSRSRGSSRGPAADPGLFRPHVEPTDSANGKKRAPARFHIVGPNEDRRGRPMIKRVSHAPVWVLDQDSAKKFYTKRLGFEVRTDATMDALRWLTVGPKDQPDFEIILGKPGPPMVDDEAAKAITALVARGQLGAGAMETDDCQRTYDELTKKGVQFLQEPADRPYGIEAVFRDDSGNWFSLTERKPG